MIKIILFIAIMLGISYILDRITKNKFDNRNRLKLLIFSTILSTSAFLVAFILFYLLS
jgi:hypothetical protein